MVLVLGLTAIYHKLKKMIKNYGNVALEGKKGWSTDIIDKMNCANKSVEMIKDEIRKADCATTRETTLDNLNFNFFNAKILIRNFIILKRDQ